jgi:hypothetical protein
MIYIDSQVQTKLEERDLLVSYYNNKLEWEKAVYTLMKHKQIKWGSTV